MRLNRIHGIGRTSRFKSTTVAKQHANRVAVKPNQRDERGFDAMVCHILSIFSRQVFLVWVVHSERNSTTISSPFSVSLCCRKLSLITRRCQFLETARLIAALLITTPKRACGSSLERYKTITFWCLILCGFVAKTDWKSCLDTSLYWRE